MRGRRRPDGVGGSACPIRPIYRPFHTLVNRLLPVPGQGPFNRQIWTKFQTRSMTEYLFKEGDELSSGELVQLPRVLHLVQLPVQVLHLSNVKKLKKLNMKK